MLVLCYGIPKSGSTLAFEMVRGVLENAGFRQEHLRNLSARGARNFSARVSKESLVKLITQIGPDRKIAVKTHSDFPVDIFRWLEAGQANGDVQIVASYRDPRDVCLSLLDAGQRSRAKGGAAFSNVDKLETAAEHVVRRIKQFRRWASIKGTLRLDYEMVAFAPDLAIDAIEAALGVRCDHQQVKKYAFKKANTQRNKMKRRRHVDELSNAQKRELLSAFRRFIRHFEDGTTQDWLDQYRHRVIAQTSASGLSGSLV